MVAIDDDGCVAFANSRAQDLFGYELPELIGRDASDLVPVGLVANGGGHDGDPVEGMTAAMELRGRRRDGVEFPAEITLSPLQQNGDIFTIAAVRDASERNQIEAELRRTKDRLSEAQRVGGFGSFEWDPNSGNLSWSDQLFRIYGLEPGEVEPSFEEFVSRIHPDDRDGVVAQIQETLAECGSFENIKRGIRPDNSVFDIHTQAEVITDEDGKPMRIVGICKDVTLERKAEEATAKLASIVLSSEDAIVTCSPACIVTSWNPSAARLYGYGEEEALGLDATSMIPADRLEDEEAKLAQLIEGRAHRALRDQADPQGRDRDRHLADDVAHPRWRKAQRSGSRPSLARSPSASSSRTRLKQLAEPRPADRPLQPPPLRGGADPSRRQDAAATATGGAVLVLDLDNFKYVNDALRPWCRRRACCAASSALLLARLRESDVVARLGGDEFAILRPGAPTRTRPVRWRRSCSRPSASTRLQVEGRPVKVTTSIGVTLIDEATREPRSCWSRRTWRCTTPRTPAATGH